MVYLARSPQKNSGHLSWTFEMNDASLVFDSLKLSAKIGTFQEGKVRWKVQKFYHERESEVELIEMENCQDFDTKLTGAERVTLTSILSGGKGNLAWQHAQLFRQNLNSENEHSMVIRISSKKR